MKKAILALAVMALGYGSANAQTGLEKAKFFDLETELTIR